MKKHLLYSLSLLVFCCWIIGMQAQNDKGEKVKTKFLRLPGYDISSVDPATINSYFVVGSSSFGTEKMKDTKSVCVPKGGGIKDAIEITTYYYEVPFNAPSSYLIAKDGAGKIVYAEQVSTAGADAVKFGFDKCEYWIAETLKKEWKANAGTFKATSTSEKSAALHDQAKTIASSNIFPSIIEEEFEVFTAKGKDHDYAELDKVWEQAQKAYASIAENGPNADAFDQLNAAAVVWEKELTTLDPENKKARINKNVAKGLYENLMNAYMYTYQSRKALKAGMDGRKLYGNFSNNRTIALDARVQMIGNLEIASKNNSSLVNDPAKLNDLAKKAGSYSASVEMKPQEEFIVIEQEYNTYRAEVYSEQMGASKELFEEAVAAGEANKYDPYVTQSTGGKMLMMSPLTMAPTLEELPKEICEISDLKQMIIMSNSIAVVPPEIGKLTGLTKLDLSKNKLTTLPIEIGQLSSLKTLNLSNNPISEIPDSIKNCSSLKTLNIKGTKLSVDQIKALEGLIPDVKIKY